MNPLSILVGAFMFLSNTGAFMQCNTPRIAFDGRIPNEWHFTVSGCQGVFPNQESERELRMMSTFGGDGIIDIPGLMTLQAHAEDPAEHLGMSTAGILSKSRWNVKIVNGPFGFNLDLVRR